MEPIEKKEEDEDTQKKEAAPLTRTASRTPRKKITGIEKFQLFLYMVFITSGLVLYLKMSDASKYELIQLVQNFINNSDAAEERLRNTYSTDIPTPTWFELVGWGLVLLVGVSWYLKSYRKDTGQDFFKDP